MVNTVINLFEVVLIIYIEAVEIFYKTSILFYVDNVNLIRCKRKFVRRYESC